jgi:hypothetical protein
MPADDTPCSYVRGHRAELLERGEADEMLGWPTSSSSAADVSSGATTLEAAIGVAGVRALRAGTSDDATVAANTFAPGTLGQPAVAPFVLAFARARRPRFAPVEHPGICIRSDASNVFAKGENFPACRGLPPFVHPCIGHRDRMGGAIASKISGGGGIELTGDLHSKKALFSAAQAPSRSCAVPLSQTNAAPRAQVRKFTYSSTQVARSRAFRQSWRQFDRRQLA